MKTPATICSAFLLLLCGAVPASAQLIEAPNSEINTSSTKVVGLNSAESPSFASDKSLSGIYQLPTVHKSEADLSENEPVFVSQDALTLSTRQSANRNTDSILDLSVLKERSAYRNATLVKFNVSDAQASGIHAGLAQISAAYQQPGKTTESADCDSVSMSVSHRIMMDPSRVLEIVESEISANENCACEIVKISIRASGADEALVADITEVAITSAPQSMRMISQCAIAAMPEALSAVQAVLAKLDPNRGDSSYSAKDSKSGKDAVASAIAPPVAPPNPLIFIPLIFPPGPPPNFPPPQVTDPNP